MSIYFGADSTTQHSAGVGKLLDLQQYQATGTISHSTNTFTDIPSFSLNLTPQTNSKVLISFCGSKGASTTNPVRFRPVRTISGSATALGMQSTADWQGN